MLARISGHVDLATLAPRVNIRLMTLKNEEVETSAVIDTGYNGEFALPRAAIQKMGLDFLGTIDGELADGQVVELELYLGRINWSDEIHEVGIVASRSENLLLGTALLLDCRLEVDFKRGSVTIEKPI